MECMQCCSSILCFRKTGFTPRKEKHFLVMVYFIYSYSGHKTNPVKTRCKCLLASLSSKAKQRYNKVLLNRYKFYVKSWQWNFHSVGHFHSVGPFLLKELISKEPFFRMVYGLSRGTGHILSKHMFAQCIELHDK